MRNILQILTQSHSMIEFLVFTCIKKSYRPLLHQRDNHVDYIGTTIQFGKISSLELRPLLRLMVEPLPQLGTRSDLFHPNPLKMLPAHPTRPKAVHQNSGTIVTAGIVNSFDGNAHIRHPDPMEGGTGRPSMNFYGFFRKLSQIERSRNSSRENAPTAKIASGSMRIQVTVRMNSLDVISGLRANHNPSLMAW